MTLCRAKDSLPVTESSVALPLGKRNQTPRRATATDNSGGNDDDSRNDEIVVTRNSHSAFDATDDTTDYSTDDRADRAGVAITYSGLGARLPPMTP